jgi:hypothetical protein
MGQPTAHVNWLDSSQLPYSTNHSANPSPPIIPIGEIFRPAAGVAISAGRRRCMPTAARRTNGVWADSGGYLVSLHELFSSCNLVSDSGSSNFDFDRDPAMDPLSSLTLGHGMDLRPAITEKHFVSATSVLLPFDRRGHGHRTRRRYWCWSERW